MKQTIKGQQIGKILIDFFDTMNSLEDDIHKEGKRSVCLIKAINDLHELLNRDQFPDSEADGFVFCGKCGQCK